MAKMVVEAFDMANTSKIYTKKRQYATLKYNNEIENGTTDLLTTIKKVELDKLNNGSIDTEDYDQMVDYLKSETIKFNDVLKKNKDTIDTCYDALMRNLVVYTSLKDNDVDKCRFLFEYVCKDVKLSISNKYNNEIPYGNDFPFSFTEDGIPLDDKDYKGILFGSVNTSSQIASFLADVGREVGLDIKCHSFISGVYNLPTHYNMNSLTIDGKVYYMDAYAVISGKKKMEDAFLVDWDTIKRDTDIRENAPIGNTYKVDYKKDMHIEEYEIARDRILPEIEYVPNDVFGKANKEK